MIPNRSSRTAEGAVLIRTFQQQLPTDQRVLQDPWIASLARSAQRWIARIPFLVRFCLWNFPRMVDYVPVRDRFADEVVDDVVRAGARQIVVLGAGLDTISYRVLQRHPNCCIYEVDHPATQAEKRLRSRQLAAQFGHAIRYVSADFEVDDFRAKLIDCGFRTDQLSAVIWMGVVYYLSEDAVKLTLSRARDLMTTGSQLAFDFWPPSHVEASNDPQLEARRKSYEKMGESLKFGIEPSDLAEFVKPLGFGIARMESINALNQRYVNRDMRLPAGMSVAAVVAEPRE